MFSSSKINYSPRTNNTNLYNSVNESTNGISRNIISPKITSTPLVNRESIFATPPKHKILSPRRYSLSEIATPPRSSRRDLTEINPAGPLLASTRYNVNVSTYEDTKSPGLASRIVQYNEETERDREYSRPPTHQAQYGSPGMFPVVHLFKKKLPVLEPKPRRVTIRIASPDYSRHHSHEYNRKLLEGIVRPSSYTNRGSPFSPSSQSSSSTRSVLDALKEISRKRIHASEEYDLNEDSGKRLRTMNNVDSNKRLRDDSSLEKSPSPSKPTSKRVCMYDEYAASCSSMDFSFKKTEQSEQKRKSISISTLTENPKESKQVRLINAETQTATNEAVKNTELTTQETSREDETRINEEPVKKKNVPLKIFDDAPLERIRKNRLAALMGSLTGKEPVLLPKPDYASVLNSTVDMPDGSDTTTSEVSKSTEKPLVSILSSPKKSSPIKSNKHVHFSVPESTSQTNLNSAPIPSFPTTPSSTLVAASVSSAGDTTVTFGSSSKVNTETPAPPSSPIGLHSSSSETTTLPVITFASGSNSSSATSIVSKESSTSLVPVDAPKTQFAIPSFQFKPPTSSTTILAPISTAAPTNQLTFPSSAIATSNYSTTTSPPKMGGFKFDLTKSVTTSTANASGPPTFSFGSTSQSDPNKTTSEFRTTTTSSTNPQSSAPTFSFGSKTTNPASTSSITSSTGSTFGTTTFPSIPPSLGTAVVAAPPTPSFKFGSTNNANKPAPSVGFPVAHNNTTAFGGTSTTTSAPAFGTNSTTTAQVSQIPATSVPTFNAPKTPIFSFGAPKTTAPSISSGFGVQASTTSAPITFGAPSTTSTNFGTNASSFLNTSTSSPATGFGVTTTASTLGGGFGSPAATANTGFGSNTAPMFGASKPISPFAVSNSNATPAFGSPATANSSPFAKSSAPQFPQITTQSTFGAPTTTVSFGTTNSFGGATTTPSSSSFGGVNNSPSVFGAKTGGFGAPPNNTNIFGGAVNTQPSGFGTSTAKPIFGPTTTSPFGTTVTTTTPSFGSSNPPAFNFAAKTTASSSFGTGNAFGATTTASAGFGTSATPAFGSSNSFGGGTTNFGTANAFGGPSAPAFGVVTTCTPQSSFGTTATPAFGTANTGFNSGDKSSTFGNASTASPFGSSSASPFASSTSTPGFGAANNTAGFGTNSAVSAFAKPQATQNAFGAPTSNTFGTNNSFGATQPQAASFGSTNPTNTQNAVFSFGATTTPKPPGVFSFGTGASNEVPKPSFNFTAGSSGPPAFGSSSGTPSFGSTVPAPFGATAIPQFNAPQTAAQGMFSIGSGSTSGKARTHLKPKRRT